MIHPRDALPQWNTYTCGPAALRAALLCYGDRVDGRRLARLAGTTWWGTEVDKLDDAALAYGFRIKHEVYRDAATAALALRGLLSARKPLLLSTENDAHWIVAVRATSRYVWIFDPAFDEGEGLQRVTWRFLLRRIHQGLPDELRFHLYPLVPA